MSRLEDKFKKGNEVTLNEIANNGFLYVDEIMGLFLFRTTHTRLLTSKVKKQDVNKYLVVEYYEIP